MYISEAFKVDDALEMLMEGNRGRPPLRARLRMIRSAAEGDNYGAATHIEQLLS